MKLFKVTFNPMASARDVFAMTYRIQAETKAQAQTEGENLLASDGYPRNKFRKQVVIAEIEAEVKVEEVEASTCEPHQPASKEEVAQEEAEETSLDPFADFLQPVWSVETLNQRLDALKVGERLVIDNLSDDIYHQVQGVSSSKLKLFIECPQKYKAKYVDCIIPVAEKKYFDMGKAIHTTMLEPHLFESSYIKQPSDIKVRNGNKWKEFKAQADEMGKTVLTADQFEDMVYLTRSVESNHTAKALTSGGKAEVSIFIRDAETGLIIKCRPDYMIDELIVDLKSAANAAPNKFGYDAKKLGYHIQDAMYSDIAQVTEFVFLVVESSRPFVITAPVILDEQTKRLGYLKYRKALTELKQCMDSGYWPSYTEEAVTVELNNFEKAELEALEAEQLINDEQDNNMEYAA
ncbi:PD-(D/E)XK nuclease-like domain-containing protein [Shewanella sp. 202IG2-18]|uniref:PD-(D/E)XK nuclease-like domain-containing protein n=1 Tax=Parashewanella hymeniacidonis TaxID=2807618 RepID=UPI0019616655|nr:PD-(D/E)XK nuclease-like domain-containing protein [Parashewanella hymeniacidonis]MBM7070911.1 PD-(D/E)XK nuclease-like domain-containing protein [Parashewanella hymeniacidonis]